MNKRTKMILGSLLGLLLVVLLCVYPLLTQPESEFAGADDQAGDVIAQIDENFKEWTSPLWEPPGSETESLLFALQAALGSGVFFYFLGYFVGCKKERERREKP